MSEFDRRLGDFFSRHLNHALRKEYDTGNFAAVKFVTKPSQWRKIATRRRRAVHTSVCTVGIPASPASRASGSCAVPYYTYACACLQLVIEV
ncbi:hypothetical protein EVAR_84252_1 [Eumeta japonica]|uniref:Uncharacterized protein n=1 Tax=Eumeta variegata TaxID=151549 RepID=A0A4C1WQW2_EUMVA|nr:hypothetical protein EVAR_84252_1 [Eumeta japonica]